MKSATTMEAMVAEAATVPAMLAMLMESTPKTAEIPATVVGITIVIAVGIRIRIVIVVMVLMFSLSSWCNKTS